MELEKVFLRSFLSSFFCRSGKRVLGNSWEHGVEKFSIVSFFFSITHFIMHVVLGCGVHIFFLVPSIIGSIPFLFT